MSQRTLLDALDCLGLREKEARIYLALLESGDASAYLVAKKSALKRPTAYVILEQLRERGIVHLLPHATRRLYRAKTPSDIFLAVQERLQKAERALPSLAALEKKERTQIQAIYFEGFEGVQEAMRYGMREMEGKEILAFWADVDEETDRRFGFFRDWHELFKLNRIALRGFIPDRTIHEKYRRLDRGLSPNDANNAAWRV